MKSKYQKTAENIQKTYEENLFSFDLNHQYLFALRRWRISGQEKYLPPIFYDFQMQSLRKFKWMKNLKDKSYRQERIKKLIEEFKPKNIREERKKEAYKNKPEFIFFPRLLRYLFLLKTYRLEPLFASEFSKAIGYLKKFDFNSLLSSLELWRDLPSLVINSLYYLKYLRIMDLEVKLKPAIWRFWQKEKITKEYLYTNKIYALTHLVISASFFYQRFLPSGDYQEILKFFENNLEKIINRTNPDIVGEVGLCFRLTKTQGKVIEKIKEYIVARYDPKLGYIPREEENSLERAGHRNIIAILLLSDYSKLFPGPNLLRFLQKTGKKLYLPFEGEAKSL